MQRGPDQSDLVYLVHSLLQCSFVVGFFFFKLWSRDRGIQGLQSLLKVNKPNNLNSAVLVHVFLGNYKEYPIYYFFLSRDPSNITL